MSWISEKLKAAYGWLVTSIWAFKAWFMVFVWTRHSPVWNALAFISGPVYLLIGAVTIPAHYGIPAWAMIALRWLAFILMCLGFKNSNSLAKDPA